MADEPRSTESGTSETGLGKSLASESIPRETCSPAGPHKAAQTRLEESEPGNIDSKIKNMDQAAEVPYAADDTATTSEIFNTANENVQDCIVHVPDLLQKEGDGRQSACLNKATGMSNRLGIHYQIISPGYRTACIVLAYLYEYCCLTPVS
jgi:hypothetical protein